VTAFVPFVFFLQMNCEVCNNESKQQVSLQDRSQEAVKPKLLLLAIYCL